MTSTKPGSQVGGYRREVDYQKLGPALIIASSLVLAIRTARWDPTYTDSLANVEWKKEVEHSVLIAKGSVAFSSRRPDLIQSKDVAWNVPTHEEVPK